MIDLIQSLDTNILMYIQDVLRTPWMTPVMVFFSLIGNLGLVWIVIGALLLIPKRTRRGGILTLICLLAAYLVNDHVLKELVARPRPYSTLTELEILVAQLSSTSFPSGHTNSSFAAALALTLAFGKRGALAYIPATLIALSRCYVGVHYPSDVLAGMIVGTLVAFVAFRLAERIPALRAPQPKTE